MKRESEADLERWPDSLSTLPLVFLPLPWPAMMMLEVRKVGVGGVERNRRGGAGGRERGGGHLGFATPLPFIDLLAQYIVTIQLQRSCILLQQTTESLCSPASFFRAVKPLFLDLVKNDGRTTDLMHDL